jgi:uncharacterized delta-60 repeat protein
VSTSDATAQAVVEQADHKLLVAGYTTNATNHSFALLRYNTDGSLDTSFGTSGVLTPVVGSNDTGRALAIQPDGKILMAGTTVSGSNDFALIRLNTDGSFDTAFGTNGKVTTDIGMGTDDQVQTMLLQSDGRILVAGSSNNGGGKEFAVARYTGVGGLDPTFATGGRTLITVGSGDAEINALAIQGDGKIDLVGYSSAGTEKDYAMVRISATGALDTTWGTGGKATYSFGPGASIAYGIVLQTNGKLVLSGTIQNAGVYDFGIMRIWP